MKNKLALVLYMALVSCFVFKAYHVCKYEINWDEFLYLSKIHLYLNGKLASPFQSFYVHLFTWVRYISINEVEQVISARIAILLLSVLSSIFLFKISRTFLSHNSALMVILTYQSFAYVCWQGTTFRADPIAVFLILGSFYFLINTRSSYKSVIISSFLLALATIITVKTSLYAFFYGSCFLVHLFFSKNKMHLLKRYLVFGFGCMGSYIGFYFLHLNTLSNGQGSEEMVHSISTAAGKTIFGSGFFPQYKDFLISTVLDFIQWGLMTTGVVLCINQIIKKRIDMNSCLLLTFCLPVSSFLFYRNAFPYFYAYILPFSCILAGNTWEHLESNKRPTTVILQMVLILVCVTSMIVNLPLRTFQKPLDKQFELVELVYELFPEPVNYIDRCSMISSYEKVGFFMSTWGLESYNKNGVPVIAQAIYEKDPAFILANIFQLDFEHKTYHSDTKVPLRHQLLSEDLRALKDHFIHYWGPIYIRGKKLKISQSHTINMCDLNLDGCYYVSTSKPLLINGKKYENEELIMIMHGKEYEFKAVLGDTDVILSILPFSKIKHKKYTPKALFTGF